MIGAIRVFALVATLDPTGRAFQDTRTVDALFLAGTNITTEALCRYTTV